MPAGFIAYNSYGRIAVRQKAGNSTGHSISGTANNQRAYLPRYVNTLSYRLSAPTSQKP